MTDMLNVGILGAGGIAALSHLPEIASIAGMQVTHICGRTESRLKLLCERFDVPRYSLTWNDLLADDSLDAIIVALPHPLHAEGGIAVLEAGKHLFVEKPLCASMDEADQLLATAEKRPQLTVYCRPSFSAEIYEIRKQIGANAIGSVASASARVSHGGPEVYYAEVADAFNEQRRTDDLWFFDASKAGVGALFDMGVYAVANLVAVLGRVVRVTARLTTVAKPTTLEDTAMVIMEFNNGVLASAQTSWCDPARTATLSVHGSDGKIDLQQGANKRFLRTVPSSADREHAPPIVEPIQAPAVPSQHEDWLQHIRQGTQPALSNLWTARHVTEILLATQSSSQTDKSIAIGSSPRLD